MNERLLRLRERSRRLMRLHKQALNWQGERIHTAPKPKKGILYTDVLTEWAFDLRERAFKVETHLMRDRRSAEVIGRAYFHEFGETAVGLPAHSNLESESIPRALVGSPYTPEEAMRIAEYRAWREKAVSAAEAAKAEWIWTTGLWIGLERGLQPGGEVVYPTTPKAAQKWAEGHTWWLAGRASNGAERLGRLWAREKRAMRPEVVAAVEERLSSHVFGRQILEASKTPPEVEVARMYARDADGTPVFQGEDGEWYSPRLAEALIHSARPWTRAELMEQFAMHARLSGIAADFYSRLSALVGPAGQGGVELMSQDAAQDLRRAELAAPLLVDWVCAKLKVARPEKKPRILPVRLADRATYGGAGLLGCHREDEPDVIRLAAGWSLRTLVHEIVHWVCTVTGYREANGLTWEVEERLADSISMEAVKS